MIETLRLLRRATSDALAQALRPILDNEPSEVEIRDQFHAELAKLSDVSEEGWYQPPPKGLIVTVGIPPKFDRLDQPSFRLEHTWPSHNVRMTDESVLYAYGSRVHVPTGTISDTSCTMYRGSSAAIHSHLRDVWHTTLDIARIAELGMPLSELHRRAMALITQRGFVNNIVSVTDPSATNIGHTVPWSYESITSEEVRVLEEGSPSAIADLVNQKRRFVSAIETLVITDGMALTIEPRLRRADLPMVNFHVVVAFANGRPCVITEFESLFALFDMVGFDRLN